VDLSNSARGCEKVAMKKETLWAGRGGKLESVVEKKGLNGRHPLYHSIGERQ